MVAVVEVTFKYFYLRTEIHQYSWILIMDQTNKYVSFVFTNIL